MFFLRKQIEVINKTDNWREKVWNVFEVEFWCEINSDEKGTSEQNENLDIKLNFNEGNVSEVKQKAILGLMKEVNAKKMLDNLRKLSKHSAKRVYTEEFKGKNVQNLWK